MRVVENVVIGLLLSGLTAVAALVVTFPVQQDDSDPPSCASIVFLPASCSESDSWQVSCRRDGYFRAGHGHRQSEWATP